jgi:chromosome segregation ATPase
MSEVDDLKEQLASKQKVLDELFARLQSKDADIRMLTSDRKVLQDDNEILRKKIKMIEARLGDRERDHHILMSALSAVQQTYIHAVDHLDSMVGLLESAKHRTDNTPDREAIENAAKIAEEYVAQVSRIRHMATNDYARRVQEGILIEIVRNGGLSDAGFVEVMRLAKNRIEYFTDGDNWQELQKLIGDTE